MSRTRMGAVTLATAGVLFVLYPAIRPWHDEATVSGATTSMSSPAWVAAHFFAILGFILVPLGLLAIRDALAGTRSASLALTAAIVTWVGAGLTLPYYGAEDFGLHAIASRHVGNLIDVINAVRYQPLAITIFGTGLVLLGIGAVFAAVAVWRASALPRYSGIVFAIGFALFLPQFYMSPAVRIAHGLLTGVGLAMLAVSLWRAKASAAPEATATTTAEAITEATTEAATATAA